MNLCTISSIHWMIFVECLLINDSKEVQNQIKKIKTCESIAAKYKRDGASLETKLKSTVRCYQEMGKILKPPHYKLTLTENDVFNGLVALYATTSAHYSIS